MRARGLTLLAICALAGCSGGSGSNPFGSLGSIGSANPFGGGRSGGATEASLVAGPVDDGSVLIAQLARVRPEPALRGVILRAEGVADTQGYWGGRLQPLNDGAPDERGIVTYEFRVFAPETPQPAGPERARQIMVATFVPDTALDEVRGFRILARANSVDLRR